MAKKFFRHEGEARDDLVREVAAYFIGDKKKKIKGKTITELLDMTGFKTRQTIYDYLNRAIELEIEGIKKDPITGKYERVEITFDEKFEKFCSSNEITNNPLVADWIENGLANAGFSGTGAVSSRSHILAVEKLCNFCKISPRQLIQSTDLTGTFLQKYLNGLRSGEIKRMTNRKNSSPEIAFYSLLMGVRHFVQFQGLALRKGMGGIWNAKVKGHGNYSDIKLSKEQFVKLENYLMNNGGIDSDLYRIVWIGIESCARKSALLSMTLDYTIDNEDPDNVTYFMQAIESKTKHIKNGKQTKHITRLKTQQSLDFLKARPNKNLIWDQDSNLLKMYEDTLIKLKKLWLEIGCTSHYFQEEPFHAMRHIGAHYWLAATDYDFEFVADLGGWSTSTELKQSYGEIPPEVISRKMKKFRVSIKNVGEIE